MKTIPINTRSRFAARRPPTIADDQLMPGDRSWSAIALADLKAQLLEKATFNAANETLARLCRLAAGEAEALAWQTPFPLLFLPVLLEEKLEKVRRYAAYQSRFDAK